VFTKKAIKKLAAKSGHKFFLHACFVTRGGSVISFGNNHGCTHAEVRALNKIKDPRRRKGTVLYSFRMRRTGSLGCAKPCPACLATMVEAGVEKCYYSDWDGSIKFFKL
jgi:tRNA(Arg) A34 adenosine deaminase TadA